MADKKLTAKEAKFIDEYLKCLNASKAAIKAGYKAKNAGSIGWQKLQKTTIQDALQIARQELSAKSGIKPEMVIKAFADIAFSDIADCYDENGYLKPIHEIPAAARQSIAGVEVDQLYEGFGENRENTGQTKKVKRWDKVKALDSLAKHFGLYNADTSQKPKGIRFEIVYEEKKQIEDGDS